MTHPIFAIPSHQCAVCGSNVHFRALTLREKLDETVTHCEGYCGKCDVTVEIPLTLLQCEVIANTG